MFLVFDWWLDVIWLKSHRNATYCIDFNIVIRILNTPVSAKMAQGQRKWRAVCYKDDAVHDIHITWYYVWTANLMLLTYPPPPPPPPKQNGRHFADDVFKSIFLNENFVFWFQMSRMFVLNGPFDIRRELVQIMAWRREAIIWNNADPVQWRIYAALWGDE